jgi:preprotein translocase subunit Sec61beta
MSVIGASTISMSSSEEEGGSTTSPRLEVFVSSLFLLVFLVADFLAKESAFELYLAAAFTSRFFYGT